MLLLPRAPTTNVRRTRQSLAGEGGDEALLKRFQTSLPTSFPNCKKLQPTTTLPIPPGAPPPIEPTFQLPSSTFHPRIHLRLTPPPPRINSTPSRFTKNPHSPDNNQEQAHEHQHRLHP